MLLVAMEYLENRFTGLAALAVLYRRCYGRTNDSPPGECYILAIGRVRATRLTYDCFDGEDITKFGENNNLLLVRGVQTLEPGLGDRWNVP